MFVLQLVPVLALASGPAAAQSEAPLRVVDAVAAGPYIELFDHGLGEPPIAVDEWHYGDYTVAVRRSALHFGDGEDLEYYGVLLRVTRTDDPDTELYVIREHSFQFELLDVLGTGTPSLVVTASNLGRSCCDGIYILELGEELTPLLEMPVGSLPFKLHPDEPLRDLDGDGRLEVLGFDGTPADYSPAYGCPAAIYAPSPPVVLAHDGAGFVVATDRFQEQVAAQRSPGSAPVTLADGDIAAWLASLPEARRSDWQIVTCDLAAVVLDLLHAARPDDAWRIFDEHYPAAFVDAIGRRNRVQLALVRTALESPFIAVDVPQGRLFAPARTP